MIIKQLKIKHEKAHEGFYYFTAELEGEWYSFRSISPYFCFTGESEEDVVAVAEEVIQLWLDHKSWEN